jgi:hypothetical protein
MLLYALFQVEPSSRGPRTPGCSGRSRRRRRIRSNSLPVFLVSPGYFPYLTCVALMLMRSFTMDKLKLMKCLVTNGVNKQWNVIQEASWAKIMSPGGKLTALVCHPTPNNKQSRGANLSLNKHWLTGQSLNRVFNSRSGCKNDMLVPVHLSKTA